MNPIELKNYKVPSFLIPKTEILIDILENKVLVESSLTIERNSKKDNEPLILNGLNLEIESIFIDEIKVTDYNYKDNLLTINSVPDSFILKTTVSIDPFNNKSLEGLYKSGDILCSQNEAEGFRRITFFLDRPDVMSKFTITVQGDKKTYPLLLSNGNLIKSKELSGNRHSNTWEDPFPKPCYLVAVVAGDLDLLSDTYKTGSGRNIELEIYTDKGMTNRAYHAMESLKKSMLWDEETFGLEYDLDLYMIVAVDSFNAGAMENKGLNIFNSQYVLAEPSTATDSDYDGVEGVIGHEYFHNWTGNRVTCRDWFQLTLKEGLTVFRDQEFSGDMTDRTVKRIDDVSILRGHQFPEDNGPNAHPIKPESYIEINNFYTATVYEKGAEVIRMINTLIGKKNFRKGMDLYFKLHDGNAVTTENFVDAMAEASGVDLTQFKLWYKQAGTPVVNIKSAYKDGMFTLTVDQTLPKTSFGGTQEPMFFPLTIGLYTKDGNDLTPVDNKLIISKASESFSFETGKDVIPSLLQNFSAPVIVNYDYTTNELITLLKYDRDNFNRFDSARRLTMISIDQIIKDSVVGKDGTIDSNIIDALKYLLEDNSLDNRYKATLLYIPTLDIITATMNVYDYQLADKALKTYKTLLATELKGTLFRLFEDNVTDVFELTKEAIGQRTIKNRALNILSFLGDDIKEIAQLQFNRANNMTDYMAAYSALQECEDSVRIEANSEFYGKWKDNFLVMNKWFAIQASRNDLEVLNDIKELSSKDIFDKNNPNRIRSLYGIFSGRNLAQFHREDGKGYELIANLIMDIDGFNPHVSARMATTFQTYSYLPPALAEKMKIQLEAILKIDDISSGLYEIVSKTLKTRA